MESVASNNLHCEDVALTNKNSFTATTCFTVGKVEGSNAVLISEDLRIIEVSSKLLPTSTYSSAQNTAPIVTGQRVAVTLKRDFEAEEEDRRKFTTLQQEIAKKYTQKTSVPVINKVSVGHLFAVVEWNSSAQFIANGARLLKIECLVNGIARKYAQLGPNRLRIMDLSPNTKYHVSLQLRTTAGTIGDSGSSSHDQEEMEKTDEDVLTILTPPKKDLSALSVCLMNDSENDVKEIEQLATENGFKINGSISDTNTSHIICCSSDCVMMEKGDLVSLAEKLRIPIAKKEWLFDCCREGEMKELTAPNLITINYV